ncbi:uncharacterized protein LOC116433298 [Nomia melanderi]|uniref:uncharacterized protein LOC116433298 n=1 Tax=Nomia melanderi TaxID=2448451 RepID=UPI003FCC60BD
MKTDMLGYVTLVCIVSLAGCGCQTTGIPADANDAPQGINLAAKNSNQNMEDDFVPFQGERFSTFDWMLFKAVSRRETGNFLLSPVSLKIALVLLYEGAQEQSADEIASAMQLPGSLPAVRNKFGDILRSLQESSPAYSLNIGSRVYIDSNIVIRQRYQAILKTFYGTDVIHANLSNARPIVESVNGWISNVTNGNIQKMIEDEDKVKESLMLMMNAVYFKGSWYRKYFSPEDTRIGSFHVDSKRTVQVPFMHTNRHFFYSESSELNAKILRIPYDGNKFSLYLILPQTQDGIGQVAENINQYVLTRHMWLMQDLLVDVMIPKFKFQYTTHLEPALRELGIRDIFDDTASLTNIAITRRISRHLKVSDIVQKTGIEVNENGTTAFAATEVEIGNKIDGMTFHANHPFAFFIEDESTATILYSGRVANPSDAPEFQTHFADVPDADSNLQVGLRADDRDNLFNTYFMQDLSNEYVGNLVSSPASIKAALTMLTEGSDGDTRSEIVSTLRLPDSESSIRKNTQRVLLSLKKNVNGTEIDLSTCFWIDQKLNLSDNYTKILRSHYTADVKTVNFANPQSVALDINNWVQRVTRAQISSPLVQNVPPDTQLLLTSAIYFKGKWLRAFDKAKTREECFYIPNGECRNTPFMTHKYLYRSAYISSIDADVLEIPYSDGRTSMLIVTPNKRNKDRYLRILSRDLVTVPVSVLLSSLMERSVTIHVPKFSIENNLNVVPTLQRLGIEGIFNSNARLTMIASNDTLHVTNVLQNVKINVDEEGTVAAADTEIGFEFLSLLNNDIKLDRPFLFLIVDSVTKTTLFCGRFMEPHQ